MREILFRGKRVDNGKWVYGGYYTDGKKHFIITTVKHMPDTRDWDTVEYYEKNPTYLPDFKEVIPETVGQYTGLTDKNGKKIFEGDIIAYQFFGEEHIDGVVKYGAFNCSCCDGVFGWYLDGGDIRRQEAEGECVSGNYVIGNIHDNPELLKGGANK